MPHDQLTVDDELAAKVKDIFTTRGLWSSRRACYHDLIRRGLLSLDGSGAPAATSPTEPPSPTGPVTPAPRGGSQAPGETQAANAAVPSPPTTPATPSTGVARGPGGARPAEAASSSLTPPKVGRSPRLEPRQGIPPTIAAAEPERKPEVPLPAASTSEPARGVSEVSTWTCPRCHVEMPLAGREAHRVSCTDQDPPVPLRPVASAARYPNEDELTRFVKMFLRGAKESGKAERYLVVAVQRGYDDQRVAPPGDAEALEVLRALAAKNPAIANALEPVQDLRKFVTVHESESTMSPTRKGGSRGRM